MQKDQYQSDFDVIGIEIRTNNRKEATVDGDIPKLWHRFIEQDVLRKIPNKTSSDIVALFTDYEAQRSADYSYIIGAKVEKGTAPPDGMVVKTVAPGNYAMLTSDEGPFSTVVPQIWSKVWRLEDEGEISRAYKTDFEVYDLGSPDPRRGRIQLYVGVTGGVAD